ncbi:MAG: HAMP domain-containing sensor histidine kinase [Pseudomonadota bacterium]
MRTERKDNPHGAGQFGLVRDLARASAVRQSLLFSGLYLIVLGIAGAVVWTSIQSDLLQAVDRRLEERGQVLADRLTNGTPEEVARLIGQPTPPPVEEDFQIDRFALLLAADGSRVAGFATPPALAPGFHEKPGPDLGLVDDDKFRVLVRPIGEFTLVMGENLDPLEDTTETLFDALASGAMAIALISLALGLVLAHSARRRIARINESLDRFAAGDLSVRIGEKDRTDDVGRIARTVDRMLGRLDASIKAMADMSANIAHDLKTPISRLRALVAQAQADGENGQRSDLLRRIDAEAEGLAGTFDALLRISQIRAGERRERFETIDLTEIVETVFEIYKPVAEDAAKTLTFDNGGPVTIIGDRDLLFQALVNLIENAIEYTPPCSTIDLATGADAKGVLLNVIDNGEGVPESERHRLVEPHYRRERNRGTKGAGLGLALVHSIVRLHEGHLEFGDAKPGLGVIARFPHPR